MPQVHKPLNILPTTEQDSHYTNLEKMTVKKIIECINTEDRTVPTAVWKARGQIESLIQQAIATIKNNGRIFYIGTGTSGRLGVVDASECPPTFGVDPNPVIGIIAGGDRAIRTSVEKAEDNTMQAFKDLQKYKVSKKDLVIGITASGKTPYVVGGLEICKQKKIPTGCIVCNKKSACIPFVDFPIEVIVGPEFVTGSSRMKAGTAQKLILNMITTTVFTKTGKIRDNKMAALQMSNNKLVDRAIRIVMEFKRVPRAEAERLLKGKKLEYVLEEN